MLVVQAVIITYLTEGLDFVLPYKTLLGGLVCSLPSRIQGDSTRPNLRKRSTPALLRGFLFTSPRNPISEDSFRSYLTLYDVPNQGNFHVSLFKKDGNDTKTLVEKTQVVEKPSPASGQIFEVALDVPLVSSYEWFTLKVEGAFGTYSFSNQTEVVINTRRNTTLIQTDKPIYKAGQLVHFRILTLDYLLRQVEQVADIWIENPDNVRLVQWLSQTIKAGLSQYSYSLPQSARYGSWTIFVNNSRGMESQNFNVDEYVLPKYEVTITPPSFVLASAENITYKICARYTYGKLVNGNVKIKATFEKPYYWYYRSYPEIWHEDKINGCLEYTVHEKDLLWRQNSEHRSRSVLLVATVTEDGTEIERNSSKTISFTRDPVRLQFSSSGKKNYKSGLPFEGELSVHNPDDTAKSDEKVQLCVLPTTEVLTARHHRIDTYLYCKNYTSDENGLIHYTVLPPGGNGVNLRIQAVAVNRPEEKYDDYGVMSNQPSQTISLTPWHSSAKRFIQIKPLRKPVSCESTQKFTVFLNGEDGDIFDLYHQVLTRDGIVAPESTTYVYSKIKTVLLTDETYVSKFLDSEDQSQSETILGIVTISLDVTSAMGESGYLLVHYSNSEGQVIADSLEFKIKQCPRNKVTMSFSSTKELPGKSVNVEIATSPKSLCAIEAVDKSISLLKSSSSVTEQEVFNLMNRASSYLSGYYSPSFTCIPKENGGVSTFLRRRRSLISAPYKISSWWRS